MGRTQAAPFPLGLPTPLPLVCGGNIRAKPEEAVPLLLKEPQTANLSTWEPGSPPARSEELDEG